MRPQTAMKSVVRSSLACMAMQANDDRTTDFIAVCGRTADPRNETYLRKGYAGCIRKPFTVRQVIDAIEDCTSIIN